MPNLHISETSTTKNTRLGPSRANFLEPSVHHSYCGNILECSSDLTKEQVYSRIAEFMRVNSIECEHQTSQAFVNCQMDCFLKFSVFLFEGSVRDDEKNPKQKRICVELQRLRGCAIGMHRVRRCLFQALQKSVEPSEDSMVVKLCVVPPKVCALIQDLHKKEEKNTATDPCCFVNKDFALSEELLRSAHKDDNRLGLENLLLMTKPSISSCHVDAVKVLFLRKEDSVAAFLRSQILFHLLGLKSVRAFSRDRPLVEKSQSAALEKLALRILSNSLRALSSNSCEIDNQEEKEDDYWQKMSCGLQQIIQTAGQHPQDASIAARCLRLMNRVVHPNTTDAFNADLVMDLMNAQAIGKDHHLGLELEAGKLLADLSTSLAEGKTLESSK